MLVQSLMVCTYGSDGVQRRSDGVHNDGVQRRSDGVQRRSDGVQRRSDGVHNDGVHSLMIF